MDHEQITNSYKKPRHKQKLTIKKTNKDPKHIFETHKDPNRKWNVGLINNRQNTKSGKIKLNIPWKA